MFTDDMRCYYLSHTNRDNSRLVHEHIVDVAHLEFVYCGIGDLRTIFHCCGDLIHSWVHDTRDDTIIFKRYELSIMNCLYLAVYS